MAKFESKFNIGDIFYRINKRSNEFNSVMGVDVIRIDNISMDQEKFVYDVKGYNSDSFENIRKLPEEELTEARGYLTNVSQVERLIVEASNGMIKDVKNMKKELDKRKLEQKFNGIDLGERTETSGFITDSSSHSHAFNVNDGTGKPLLTLDSDSMVVHTNYIKNATGDLYVSYTEKTGKLKAGGKEIKGEMKWLKKLRKVCSNIAYIIGTHTTFL